MMNCTLIASAGCLALAVLFLIAGCQKATEKPKGGEPAKGDSATAAPDKDREIADALAKLPEADRAAATKQKMCPVSDHALGSMGAPIKVTVKDQDVYLCCEGCKSELEADPDTFLAKLPQ